MLRIVDDAPQESAIEVRPIMVDVDDQFISNRPAVAFVAHQLGLDNRAIFRQQKSILVLVPRIARREFLRPHIRHPRTQRACSKSWISYSELNWRFVAPCA